jgi:hypothetical protein
MYYEHPVLPPTSLLLHAEDDVAQEEGPKSRQQPQATGGQAACSAGSWLLANRPASLREPSALPRCQRPVPTCPLCLPSSCIPALVPLVCAVQLWRAPTLMSRSGCATAACLSSSNQLRPRRAPRGRALQVGGRLGGRVGGRVGGRLWGACVS